MPMYRYVKVQPTLPRVPRRGLRFIPFTLIAAGVMILLWAIWPIVSFSVFTQQLFVKTVSPLSDTRTAVNTTGLLSPVVLAADQRDTTGADFTNPNTWFPTLPQKKVVTPVNSYLLSIPKLRIENATVVIAGDDLGKSLVHYGGTGLPGDYGNAVVFGHSVLPQFYNPKDYMTIFSTLPTLRAGDDILVTYDTVAYRYQVEEMTVRDPSDLSGLEQHFDDSYVTLVTCVPPGTFWKRLYVLARLVRPDDVSH